MITNTEYDALSTELKAVYDDGYNVSEDTKNPHPTDTEEHRVWQAGFDDSMFCNVQNIDPAKIIALGYGHLLPD